MKIIALTITMYSKLNQKVIYIASMLRRKNDPGSFQNAKVLYEPKKPILYFLYPGINLFV